MQNDKEQNLKYKKKYLKYKKKYLTLKKGGGSYVETKHNETDTELAPNWYNHISDNSKQRFKFMNKELDILFYSGEDYGNSSDNLIILNIIKSNQTYFTANNWNFDSESTYLNLDKRTRNILPKEPGSYSGILIDRTNIDNISKVPKIIGYVICTQEINNLNNISYIHMDFVDINSSLDQVFGTILIQYMIEWFKNTFNYRMFKFFNKFGFDNRILYLRAGHNMGLNLYYLNDYYQGWDFNAHKITIHNMGLKVTYLNGELDGQIIEDPGEGAIDTYFMVYPSRLSFDEAVNALLNSEPHLDNGEVIDEEVETLLNSEPTLVAFRP